MEAIGFYRGSTGVIYAFYSRYIGGYTGIMEATI